MNEPNEEYRGWVALILAITVGVGILALTFAALLDVLRDPEQAGVSPEYSALITSTLGVLVGGLVGYIGGRERERRSEKTETVLDEDPRDDSVQPGPGST